MKEGYKKTEIGVIPEDWEVKELDEICEFLDGMRKPIKASEREGMKGNIPYYGASGIIDWVNDYIFDEELILLGEDGENIKSRNVPLAFRVSGKCWVNNHAHVLRCKYGNINFITEVLESKDYSSYVIGSAQPKLNQAQCKKLLVQVPLLKEQEKIADILSTVDCQIDDTRMLIEKCKVLKKGLMQRLLTKGIGHNKFKKSEIGEIPVEWEVFQIKDISEFCSNGFVGTASPYYVEEGIPYLMSNNVRENRLDENKLINVNNEFSIKYPRSKIYKGDMLTVQSGHIGTSCVVNDKFDGCNCHALIITRFNTDMISPDFCAYYLNSSIGKKRLSDIFVGTTIKHINVKDFVKFKVAIPPLVEQEKIAQILSTIDNEIEENENEKQKLEELKKGLMQQLLTGKLRIK